jgi:hypothetical protein
MVSGDMADADTVEQLTQPVSGQWKEARDRVSPDLDSSAGAIDSEEQAKATNEMLDLFSTSSGDGKRKVWDENDLPFFGLPMHQITQDQYRHHIVYNMALQVEWMQHKLEMGAIADICCYALEHICCGRNSSSTHHWYLDIGDLHDDEDTIVPPPYLFGDEFMWMRLLCATYARKGHSEVSDTIDKVLSYRFRELAVLLHLLYSRLFDAEIARQKVARLQTTCPTAAYKQPDASFTFSFQRNHADKFGCANTQNAINKTLKDEGTASHAQTNGHWRNKRKDVF